MGSWAGSEATDLQPPGGTFKTSLTLVSRNSQIRKLCGNKSWWSWVGAWPGGTDRKQPCSLSPEVRVGTARDWGSCQAHSPTALPARSGACTQPSTNGSNRRVGQRHYQFVSRHTEPKRGQVCPRSCSKLASELGLCSLTSKPPVEVTGPVPGSQCPERGCSGEACGVRELRRAARASPPGYPPVGPGLWVARAEGRGPFGLGWLG